MGSAAGIARDVLTSAQTREPYATSQWDEPIAIIGMACRYPGGVCDEVDLWRVLRDGVDAIEEVPSERWNADRFYDASARLPGKMATRWGGFIHGADRFDARFFRIVPREAVSVDPQQRLLLELSWETFESAAIVPATLLGSPTAVFVGINFDDYQWVDNQASNPAGVRSMGTWAELDGYTGTGIARSIASGRISYTFGLEGPSVTLDTACSSSLVAVHQACQALRLGECEMALAGGATLLLTPTAYIDFSHMTGLARDGRCKPFDASADGLSWGDGAGLVLLKRLSAALADADPIRAIIRGSAVNQDGRSRNLTAPSERAQRRVIERALAVAGVSAADISYVETHSTGTPLGDPIEIRALGAVLGQAPDRESPLLVGSLKSNLGHTQAAAGVGSLIKTVLALENELIPASLHCGEPSPRIAWQELGVAVANQSATWPRTAAPRRAGISSFGFSGTNAHVVLEEAPCHRRAELAACDAPPVSTLFTVSGHTPAALNAQAARLAERLLADPELPLADLAHTLNRCRTHHRHRAAVVTDRRADLIEALSALSEARAHPAAGRGEANTLGKVVFVFPGAGSQWAGMGLSLLEQEPAFASALQRADEALRPYTGWSVCAMLTAMSAEGGVNPDLDRVDVIEPILFAIAVSLAALWRAWGVEPAAVVGHSHGEIAAAAVSGALSLEDAALIVARRSQLLRASIGSGMAAVELSAQHSLRPKILDVLAGVHGQAGGIPIYSTVRPQVLDGATLDASYWADNLQRPVLFSGALQRLLRDGFRFFIEISPHPLLTTTMEPLVAASENQGLVIESLRRNQGGREALLAGLGALYVRGYALDWSRVPVPRGRPVRLPTYAFQRERFWIERKPREPSVIAAARASLPDGPAHALLGPRFTMSVPSGTHYWERRLSLAELPYLAGHRVHDDAVLPVAAIVEMILAASCELLGPAALVIEKLELSAPISLSSEQDADLRPLLQLSLSEQCAAAPAAYRVQLCRSTPGSGGSGPSWVTHATAEVRRAHASDIALADECIDPATIAERCPTERAPADVYQQLSAVGVTYGPAFRALHEIRVGSNEAWSGLQLPAEAGSTQGYLFHPCLLDAALQSLAVSELPGAPNANSSIVLVAIGKLVFHRGASGKLRSHARLESDPHDATVLHGDVRAFDDAGSLLVHMTDVVLRAFGCSDPLARADAELLAKLSDDAPERRLQRLTDYLLDLLAQVLGVDLSQPSPLNDPRTPFMDLGIQSVMALELRNRLESALGLRLPTTLLYARPNALALSRELLERLAERMQPSAASAAHAPDPEPMSDDLDQLTDDELLRIADQWSA